MVWDSAPSLFVALLDVAAIPSVPSQLPIGARRPRRDYRCVIRIVQKGNEDLFNDYQDCD